MPAHQLNIRVDEATLELLKSSAYLDECTLPELLRSVIDAHVASLRTDPHIQAVLNAKAERAATMTDSKLRLIESSRAS
jgi:hypothetical protein